MKYQYNYDFLPSWKKANPQISPNAIQNAIGSKSNNAFKSWMRKDGPMPIITILRFCNAFQIPLTSFFVDSEATEGSMPRRPTTDDQLEPNGGYATLEGRQQGERSILNPLDVTVIPTKLPDTEGNALVASDNKGEHEPKETIVGNISDANMKAIIQLQHEQMEQREKLLDIIAQQQRQIADLTRKIIQMQEDQSIGYSCGRAAEPSPTRP